jgi:hypothetical protein
LAAALADVGDQGTGSIRIEGAILQVGVRPVPQVQRADLLHRDRIDTYRAQPVNVFIAAVRIDDMDGLLTAVDAVLDERQQDAVLLVRGVEECSHVTPETQDRVSETYWRVGLDRIFTD